MYDQELIDYMIEHGGDLLQFFGYATAEDNGLFDIKSSNKDLGHFKEWNKSQFENIQANYEQIISKDHEFFGPGIADDGIHPGPYPHQLEIDEQN